MLLSHGKIFLCEQGDNFHALINRSVFEWNFHDLLEGFQCTAKLSWPSLYICGTLKQRYGISFGHGE